MSDTCHRIAMSLVVAGHVIAAPLVLIGSLWPATLRRLLEAMPLVADSTVWQPSHAVLLVVAVSVVSWVLAFVIGAASRRPAARRRGVERAVAFLTTVVMGGLLAVHGAVHGVLEAKDYVMLEPTSPAGCQIVREQPSSFGHGGRILLRVPGELALRDTGHRWSRQRPGGPGKWDVDWQDETATVAIVGDESTKVSLEGTAAIVCPSV